MEKGKTDMMALELLKARLEIARELMIDTALSSAWVLEHIMGFSRAEAQRLTKSK